MLRVRTLGGFQLFLGEVPVSLGKQTGNNMVKLFMLLMLYREKGISRTELIRELFERSDAESDLGANLRITVYRLRQTLKKLGIFCPEGEDYILAEEGRYCWNRKIPVWVDANVFEEKAVQAWECADPKKSCRLGEEALKLYRGEFLPELSSEEWVNVTQLHLMKLYRQVFLSQYGILTRRKDYRTAYDLAKRAAALYPYEEYQLYMMDCLAAMKNYMEAMQLYEDTATMYFQKMGMELSDEMKKRFREIGSVVRTSQAALEGIRRMLREGDREDGNCSLISFIDNFHFVQRILPRTGQSAYIEVVTLENADSLPLEPGKKRTEEAAKILEEAISEKIRSGDTVTRYNAFTYLMLLVCISEQGCRILEERIRQSFRARCTYKKIRLCFRAFPVGKTEYEENLSVG